jgi:hypothetical protein
MPSKTVALSLAVSTLVPSSAVTQPARLEGVSPSLEVSWEPGVPRQEAFSQMLKKYGLYATGNNSTLTVSSKKPWAVKAKPVMVDVAEQSWTMHKGVSVDSSLQQWAAKSGWTVLWQLPKDWKVPHDTVFKGDFKSATTQAVHALFENGVDAHVKFHSNEVAIIFPSGANPLTSTRP